MPLACTTSPMSATRPLVEPSNLPNFQPNERGVIRAHGEKKMKTKHGTFCDSYASNHLFCEPHEGPCHLVASMIHPVHGDLCSDCAHYLGVTTQRTLPSVHIVSGTRRRRNARRRIHR